MGKEELEEYWNHVALEAEDFGKTLRVHKWKRAARNWLAHYTENKSVDFVFSAIEKYVKLKSNSQILDVGCGPGKWVRLFAERGFTTTGIDSSPWMIRLAKKNTGKDTLKPVSYYAMNAAELDLPVDFYDMVNCVTVLQHILDDDNWRKAIHNMVKVTKPHGYILIFEAAPSLVLKKSTRHLRFRTMRQYTDEFRKAGANLTYWRATDLSFPITFIGLQKYASSFNRKVYYYFADRFSLLSPSFLSVLSNITATLAGLVDYRLGETPLRLLSVGRILLFRKV